MKEQRQYSKEVPRNYYKFQSSTPKNFSQEKRLQELHKLKQSQIKVGIYKYFTDEQLGKGYSSKVYKGVEIEKIHKRYAIKVIELKKFRGSNLEMLQAQISIHKNLVHENVLRLYQVIKTAYNYYLILEYCPHGNLDEYIKQKKKLSEPNSVDIMDQVLAGYKYLLSQGIIHRDLKPANILRIGNKWKISDFGFSVKSRYGFKDRLNVGTPLYMSPESMKKSYYSAKTDIFALGVTLYEMLEGTTPWESSNEKELLEKMKNEIICPEHIKNPRIKEFITRCCDLNETKRMSKEELIQFQIRPNSSHHPTSSASDMIISATSDNSITKNIQNIQEMPSKSNSKKASILSQKKAAQIQKEKQRQKEKERQENAYLKQNTQILASEYHLIRHIYSMIKNIDSFLIEKQIKYIFSLALFKLLLKLLRFLSDKNNFYILKNWTEYRSSPFYHKLQEQIIKDSQIYERQYLQYIKHSDIKIIRAVNRRFPDLCHHNKISQKFYINFTDFMVNIIREHNHQLMVLSIPELRDMINQEINKNKGSNGFEQKKEGMNVDKNSSNLKSSHNKEGQINLMKRQSNLMIKQSYKSNSKEQIIIIKQSLNLSKSEHTQQQVSKMKESSNILKKDSDLIKKQSIQKQFIAKESINQNSQNIFQNLMTHSKGRQLKSSSKRSIQHQSQTYIELMQPLKETSHPKETLNINKEAPSSEPKESTLTISKQISLNDKIQALQSLYTIYRISQLRSYSDHKEIATEKIKVTQNYGESKMNNSDYVDLRRMLRNV